MSTFREEMLELANDLRDLPGTDFDWRPYRVTFQRRSWSGGVPGSGSPTLASFTLTPWPRLRELSQREVDGSGGRYTDGDWRVEPITYRLEDLSGGYYTQPELARPGTPTVTPQGTPGSSTWGYAVYGYDGRSSVSDTSLAGSTATGNATLDSTNYNRIAWDAISGAAYYKVFRTAAPGSPSTTGLIGTTASTTFDDTGIAGDGNAALPPCIQLPPRNAGEDVVWVVQPQDADVQHDCTLVDVKTDRVLRIAMTLRIRRHSYGT